MPLPLTALNLLGLMGVAGALALAGVDFHAWYTGATAHPFGFTSLSDVLTPLAEPTMGGLAAWILFSSVPLARLTPFALVLFGFGWGAWRAGLALHGTRRRREAERHTRRARVKDLRLPSR